MVLISIDFKDLISPFTLQFFSDLGPVYMKVG